MGALNYNLKKLYHPDPALRAELLDTNFTSLDIRQIKKEVDWLRSLKPNLNKYVYHTSLNFPKEDQFDNHKLMAIAHDYLNASGYSNNQYFIFRHHDADHPHLHLLVNRISFVEASCRIATIIRKARPCSES
ncbi:relaxase/mobilization nuclease domain-containing protein [Mucilaginibacter sp.]|uniref:relaxase/mobilization nuclease domain-containing protein n=1 Tax=Mucilaginibacter sp. TaxID=1882438 RepID=UPI003D09F026